MIVRTERASGARTKLRWAALAVVLAAACGRDGATTLRIWVMGREGEVVTELMPAFEAAHPGVRVEVQQLPWTSAHEKLLTAFVGEATPDVAPIGNTWVPELVALDALVPLAPQLATTTVVREADYFPGIWRTNVIAGQPYGVPWYVDTRVLFYRRDLLARAGCDAVPTTWNGWRAAMRAIKAQVGPERFAVLLPLDEFEQLAILAQQGTDDLLRDGGRHGNFAGAGFRGALTFYLSLFVDGLAPVATEIQVPNPWEELARGYFSFFFHGPWSVAEMRRRLPASQQALWATAPLPGPDGPGTSSAGGTSLVMFRRTAHPREAWQLIEYLSQPDVQRRFYELTSNLPPRRSSWDDPRFADPAVQAFRDQLERVRPSPPVPEWERIATELRFVSERAARQVSPATTPEELARIVDAAVGELDARAEQILDKRRWLLDREARK
jgi:multiple sugar transport system substrate-binding protein